MRDVRNWRIWDAGHPVAKRNPTQWIADDHGFANIIRGMAQPAPTSTVNKGHYHLSGPEWWLIPEGSLEWRMETNKPGSQVTVLAEQGDIVYAPQQVWHAIRFAGTGMATPWVDVHADVGLDGGRMPLPMLADAFGARAPVVAERKGVRVQPDEMSAAPTEAAAP